MVGALYQVRGVCRGECASNCLLFSVHRLVCALRRPIEGHSPQALRRIATASERTCPRPVWTPWERDTLPVTFQSAGRQQPASRHAAAARQASASQARSQAGGEGSRVGRRSAPAAPLALTTATHRASTLCDRGAVTTSCSTSCPRGFPLRSLLRSAHRYNPPKSRPAGHGRAAPTSGSASGLGLDG